MLLVIIPITQAIVCPPMPQVFTSVYVNPALPFYPFTFLPFNPLPFSNGCIRCTCCICCFKDLKQQSPQGYSCNSLYSCSLNLKQQSRVRLHPCPPSNQCATPPATVYFCLSSDSFHRGVCTSVSVNRQDCREFALS